jgi:hypothetical protein
MPWDAITVCPMAMNTPFIGSIESTGPARTFTELPWIPDAELP